MAQHTCLDIANTAEWIDQRAVIRLCDGVDGEVAAAQVFFQCYRRISVDHEAAIAAPALAFGAGQRMFFAGLRMQEHREVAAHRFEAQRQHGFGRAADHHVIVVAGVQAQQLVADGAADEIGFHGQMMPYFSFSLWEKEQQLSSSATSSGTQTTCACLPGAQACGR